MKRQLFILTSVLLGIVLTVVVSTLGYVAAATPDVQSVVPVEDAGITVPYRYQGEVDGRTDVQQKYDCGQTSVTMIIQYATEQRLTIKEVHDYIGVEGNTDTDDLKKALDHWGIAYETIADAKDAYLAIQKGQPVIAVIQAGDIPQASDYCATTETDPSEHFNRYYDFTGGHWLVAKGLSDDDNWVIVNDPNVWGQPPQHKYWYSDSSPKGADRYYGKVSFTTAFDAVNAESFKILTPAYHDRLAAQVIQQSPFLSLLPGETKVITFEVQNVSPVTFWAGRTSLKLALPEQVTLFGIPETLALDNDIPPYHQVRWEITITAPDAPGLYILTWRMQFEDTSFGPDLQALVYIPGAPGKTPPPSSGDDGSGRIDIGALFAAWMETLLEDTVAQFEALIARLLQQFEVWLQTELERLFAEIWASLLQQCCGTSALVPVSLLLVAYIARRRL